MKKLGILMSMLVGVLLIIPLISVLFLASAALGVTFPAFPLFDFVSRTLPGGVITFGIDLLVRIIRTLHLGPTDTTAKLGEQMMATGLLAVIGVVLSAAYFVAMRRIKRINPFSGLILGLIAGVPLVLLAVNFDHASSAPIVLSLIWLLVAFGVWGWAHGVIYGRLTTAQTAAGVETKGETTVTPISRREFLIRLGGASAVITVAGAGLSTLLATRTSVEPVTAGTAGSTPLPQTPEAAGLLQPAPGTRSELTPVAKHYRIDINSGPPSVIDGSTYKLMIDGLVENPVELTLDEIRKNYEAMDQYITLSCISNPIAGDLISTTRWTGISMQDIVRLAKPRPEATYIRMSGVDGFYEVVALDLIQQDRRVMLTYAFDGQPLPARNGFPLRIHIPDRYGMKQPKWITHMEFIDSWQPGYWVERTWDKEARVRATSVIDTVAVDQATQQGATRLIPVGGIAWAGARGISRVEVKVDDSEWVGAALRPPLSDKTWVIWRYDWPFQPGNHTFTVRCSEADGTPQIETPQDTHPSGATGLHMLSI